MESKEMKLNVASSLLKQGAGEIRELRRQNQQMGEKLWLVENLLELRSPRTSGGMHPDIVFEMMAHSKKLDSKEK